MSNKPKIYSETKNKFNELKTAKIVRKNHTLAACAMASLFALNAVWGTYSVIDALEHKRSIDDIDAQIEANEVLLSQEESEKDYEKLYNIFKENAELEKTRSKLEQKSFPKSFLSVFSLSFALMTSIAAGVNFSEIGKDNKKIRESNIKVLKSLKTELNSPSYSCYYDVVSLMFPSPECDMEFERFRKLPYIEQTKRINEFLESVLKEQDSELYAKLPALLKDFKIYISDFETKNNCAFNELPESKQATIAVDFLEQEIAKEESPELA